MTGKLLALGASLIFLVVAFVPLERAFAARRQAIFRREWTVDLTFLVGQYLFWNLVSVGILRWGVDVASPVLRGLWQTTATWPLLALAVVAVVLGDVLVYWFHRACHHYDILWRFHAVHHTSEDLDWVAAHREHPVDGFLTQLAQNLPAIVLGLPMEAIAGLVAFRAVWAIFVHANVRVPLGPLAYLLGGPQHHHYHHANLGAVTYNFANLAPWIDWVFGTHRLPTSDYTLGIDEPHPRGYLLQLVAPFVSRARRARLARWERAPDVRVEGRNSLPDRIRRPA